MRCFACGSNRGITVDSRFGYASCYVHNNIPPVDAHNWKPRYKHDCDTCIFLGRYLAADLYFCRQRGFPTVVARHSSDGPDYDSGLYAAKLDRVLNEAKQRAMEIGVLQCKE